MSVSVATISSIRRLSGKRRSNRGALIAACGVICLGLAITAGPVVVCIPAVAVLLLGLAGRRRPRRSSVEARCCDETELPPDAARVVVRVVVPIEELNLAARQALASARAIARADDRVVAVQVAEEAEWFRRRWEEDQHGVQLVIIESPYRVLMPPLLGTSTRCTRRSQAKWSPSCGRYWSRCAGGSTCCTTTRRCGCGLRCCSIRVLS